MIELSCLQKEAINAIKADEYVLEHNFHIINLGGEILLLNAGYFIAKINEIIQKYKIVFVADTKENIEKMKLHINYPYKELVLLLLKRDNIRMPKNIPEIDIKQVTNQTEANKIQQIMLINNRPSAYSTKAIIEENRNPIAYYIKDSKDNIATINYTITDKLKSLGNSDALIGGLYSTLKTKGFGRALVRFMIEKLFINSNINTISTFTYTNNFNSINLFRKFNFKIYEDISILLMIDFN